MTDNVMPFPVPNRRRVIWICNCGCTTFYALAAGVIECARCETMQVGERGEWRSALPSLPPQIVEATPGCTNVVAMRSNEDVLQHTASLASVDETAFLIVAQRNGAIHTWDSGDLNDGRIAWIKRKAQQAVDLIISKVNRK